MTITTPPAFPSDRVRQRRMLLQSAAALALGFGTSARAQAYPAKAIRLIVPFSAGGATDVMGRLLARSMESTLKQSVVVENRVGATGTLAANYVAKSAPDGYTALFGGVGTNSLLEFTLPSLPYSPSRDFVPAGNFCFVDFVMAVGYGSPYRTLADLLKDAKARPGEVSYQSAGPLGTLHVAQEYLWKTAGVSLNHVPYKGESHVIPDLVSGRVSLAQLTLATARQLAADKKIRMLATMAPERLAAAPDLPTVAEQGFPGFAMPTWNGVFLPKGTPDAVVQTLNDAINVAVRDERVRQQVLDLGIGPGKPNTPAEHAAFLAQERERWHRMVKDSGVLPVQ